MRTTARNSRVRRRPGGRKRAARPGGFTLIELMIVVAIIGVLIAILLPACVTGLELARRLRCRTNLRAIHQSMLVYASEHDQQMPVAPGSEGMVGAAGSARDAAPEPDTPTPVSATLWAVLRATGLPPAVFICPSSRHRKDTAGPLEADVWDFQSPRNLSYAIQYPYGERTYFNRPVFSPSEMPVLADRGPFLGDGGDLAAMPATTPEDVEAWLDDPLNRARVNSANHGGGGQNVVFVDGHAEWFDRPTAGPRSDNIYTLQDGETLLGRMHGRAPGGKDGKEPPNSLDAVLVH